MNRQIGFQLPADDGRFLDLMELKWVRDNTWGALGSLKEGIPERSDGAR